jgi:SAM-dependent methyltransferase
MDVHERLTLEESTAQTSLVVEHVQRYELAARVCGATRVLDLCCGSGYGSRILAEAGATVTGVDRDGATIDIARARIGASHGVEFVLDDAVAFLRRRAHDFEAIVCFEGLEHLEDLAGALDVLEAFARQGGRVIASVPNSKAFAEENEFHITEFGFEEATEAFRRLPDAIVATQHLIEGALVKLPGGAEGDIACEMANPENAETEYANHYIVFSNCDLGGLSSSARGLLSAAPVHYQYMQSLEVANAALRRVNERFARGVIGTGGSAAGKRASTLQSRLAEAEAAARSFDQEIEKRIAAERRVAELEHENLLLREDLANGMLVAAVASRRYRRGA